SGGAGGATNDAGRGLALYGNVAVDLITDDHTGFLAIFFDGALPPKAPLDLVQEQAGCKLLVPRSISCNPACAVGQVCTAADTCTMTPKQVGVGVLHVEGLGPTSLDLEPTSPTVLSYQAVPTLPYPPCNEGDDVKIRADAFAIDSKCISS